MINTCPKELLGFCGVNYILELLSWYVKTACDHQVRQVGFLWAVCLPPTQKPVIQEHWCKQVSFVNAVMTWIFHNTFGFWFWG